MLTLARHSLKRSRAVLSPSFLSYPRRFAAAPVLKQPRVGQQSAHFPRLQSFRQHTAGLALPRHIPSRSNSIKPSISNPLTEVSVPQISDTQRELDKHNRPEYLTEYYLPFQFRRQEKISRYSLNGVIGNGFFATVYRAVDKEVVSGPPVPVAIKSISKTKCPLEIVTRELEMMRFLQPFAKATNRLGEILDVFETQASVNFVLTLCEGGDMFDFVSTKGKLTETDAKKVMQSLFTALDCLHSHGVLHRDIKLENLLLKQKDDLLSSQLVDFGYAKHIGDKDVFKNPAGTYGYVAPEVLSQRLYTPACDIWSTGVVLYTILSGQQPFPYNSKYHQSSANNNSSNNNNSIPSEDGFQKRKKSMLSVELEAITEGRSERKWRNELAREPFSFVSAEAKDLLSSLLELDHMKRPTAKQALKHSWFNSLNSKAEAEELVEEVKLNI